MARFNTGNPVDSKDPRDLSDNAQNIDQWANSEAASFPDRLGVARRTLKGMDGEFQSFLDGSAYDFLGDYAAGIEVSARNQLIRAEGDYWRASAGTELPYTTTGAGMPEGGAFVSVGDAVLRQDLAGANGLDLIGGTGTAAARNVGTGPEDVPDNSALDSRGFAQSVASVEALRGMTIPDSLERIWLEGYYGQGTSGGGALYVDHADMTSAGNNLDIYVTANGKRVKRAPYTIALTSWVGVVFDGVTDNLTRLQDMNAALAGRSGVKVRFDGGGGVCFVDVAPGDVIFEASGVAGFEVDLNGCTLLSDLPLGGSGTANRATVLLGSGSASNIHVYGGRFENVLKSPYESVSTNRGGFSVLELRPGVRTASVHDITGDQMYYVFSGNNGGAPVSYENQARGISLYNIDVERVVYPIGCAYNGSDLKAWSFHVKGCHRLYFPYGVRNHDVTLSCSEKAGTLARLWAVGAAENNEPLSNIYARIVAKFNPAYPATAIEGIQFAFQSTSPLLMDNITLDLDLDLGGIAGQGLALIAEQDATTGQHVLDNVTISGKIKNVTSRAITPVNFAFAPERISVPNITYKDLHLSGQGSNSVLFGAHHGGVARVRGISTAGGNAAVSWLGRDTLIANGGKVLFEDFDIEALLGSEYNLAFEFRNGRFRASGSEGNLASCIASNVVVGGGTVRYNRLMPRNVLAWQGGYPLSSVAVKTVAVGSSTTSLVAVFQDVTDANLSEISNSDVGAARIFDIAIGLNQSSNRASVSGKLKIDKLTAGSSASFSDLNMLTAFGSISLENTTFSAEINSEGLLEIAITNTGSRLLQCDICVY